MERHIFSIKLFLACVIAKKAMGIDNKIGREGIVCITESHPCILGFKHVYRMAGIQMYHLV